MREYKIFQHRFTSEGAGGEAIIKWLRSAYKYRTKNNSDASPPTKDEGLEVSSSSSMGAEASSSSSTSSTSSADLMTEQDEGLIAIGDLYEEYLENFCSRKGEEPKTKCEFGKCVRKAFPKIRVRRLGSSYEQVAYYAGLFPTSKTIFTSKGCSTSSLSMTPGTEDIATKIKGEHLPQVKRRRAIRTDKKKSKKKAANAKPSKSDRRKAGKKKKASSDTDKEQSKKSQDEEEKRMVKHQIAQVSSAVQQLLPLLPIPQQIQPPSLFLQPPQQAQHRPLLPLQPRQQHQQQHQNQMPEIHLCVSIEQHAQQQQHLFFEATPMMCDDDWCTSPQEALELDRVLMEPFALFCDETEEDLQHQPQPQQQQPQQHALQPAPQQAHDAVLLNVLQQHPQQQHPLLLLQPGEDRSVLMKDEGEEEEDEDYGGFFLSSGWEDLKVLPSSPSSSSLSSPPSSSSSLEDEEDENANCCRVS